MKNFETTGLLPAGNRMDLSAPATTARSDCPDKLEVL